jgi:hypothetical protein
MVDLYSQNYSTVIFGYGAEFGCELNSVKMSSGGARKRYEWFYYGLFNTRKKTGGFLGSTGSTAYNNAVMITLHVIIPQF